MDYVNGNRCSQRIVSVGLMSAPEIRFDLLDKRGIRCAKASDGQVLIDGKSYGKELVLTPADKHPDEGPFGKAAFVLDGVTIGVDFHWQQMRTLSYSGTLKLLAEGDSLIAINLVGLEDYLLSVISSEMKSTAGVGLLKAHAVIARSWVLRNLHTHKHFDVCADDHCQRYQGIGMVQSEGAREAILATWGMVLMSGGQICDARYSKCCGGRTELFSTCWEDRDYSYLQSVEDIDPDTGIPFCRTSDESILGQVLNDYDLATLDFFDWEAHYTAEELSRLVRERTGTDLGDVTGMEVLERGPSGRIKFLRITGTGGSRVIGKELAIRHALSTSHLKSSAFDILWEDGGVVLRGRGWGHGVGLCQIGAAVMAEKGYNYRQILSHYYPGAQIVQENSKKELEF